MRRVSWLVCMTACAVALPLPRNGASEEPREIHAKGTFVHAPSGAAFPDRVGEFLRVKLYQYDREGLDVSVGYNFESSGRQIAVTAYVHPVGRTFEEDVTSMRKAHASFQLVSDRAVEVSRSRHNLGCRLARVSYEEQFAHRFGPVDSYLLVCIDGSWRLKWRLSQRTAHEFDASDLLLDTAGATAVRE